MGTSLLISFFSLRTPLDGYLARIVCCFLLMTCCAGFASVCAQVVDLPQPPRWQKSDDPDTVRVETGLVDLNVSVFARDRQQQRRSAVGPLQQKDFVVFENGVAEEITFFASASAPLDLVLLLDLSGSTSDKLDLVRKSARRFVEAARPGDRISVVTFTDTARIVAPLMTDHRELISRIKKIEKPRGGTNFWDALRYVLTVVLGGSSGGVRRSAVVCMTDGVDNALPDVPGDGSLTSFADLMEVVRRSGSIVLPIYLDTEAEMVLQGRTFAQAHFLARQQLAILAEESGGILYQARSLEDLKGIYEQVISDLSTVYSIGYRPTNRQRDGTWRAVNVRLNGRTDLAVRTKRGYYAR